MMQNKCKKILSLALILIITCSFITQKATAQIDPHFSQYYAYPLWLNPGLTGVINGDFRITANYKQQWSDISNPFRTMALSFDTHPFNHLSFGGTVLQQTAGDAGYKYLNILGSAAYKIIIDNQQMNILSIGLQVGIINRRFDPSKLRAGSQWNPITGFDQGISSGENFDKISSLDFDANMGIFYYNKNPYNLVTPFAGISIYHLSRPRDPFLNKSSDWLPIRINIHGGFAMYLNKKFHLTPHFLYLKQGSAHELIGSIYAQYLLTKYSDFIFGVSYRYKDAAIPFIGFNIEGFTLGLSYDVNTSGPKASSLNNGGFELSLSYTKQKNMKKQFLVCPKL